MVFEILARRSRDSYNDRLASAACQGGCATDDPVLVDAESRMKLQDRIAIGTLIAGSAVVTTGIVLLVLNRPYAYVPDQSIRVMPTASPSGAGILLRGEF